MPPLMNACQGFTSAEGITGVYPLAGGPGNARRIAETFANLQEHTFYIADESDFELIWGRFSSVDNTITVLNLFHSSNGDAPVEWRSGTKLVSATARSEDLLSLDNAIETDSRVAMTVAERRAVARYTGTADPFYWKPKSHPLFGYGTGQSNTEPEFPMHPDAPPLVANPNVLVWCSDGEGANWDFRPFDPDVPLYNDYKPYDATTNPNGRPWSLVEGKINWLKPYSGYPFGGHGLSTLGAALQFAEQTGRRVYFGNTAWAGRSSFHWYPGASEGDSWGQCAWQIDHHMPAMVARLAELEPDLDVFTWDWFTFNQGTTDAGILPYGFPPETYVGNWSAFFGHVGETELDDDEQTVPIRWLDPEKTLVALLQRTFRDTEYPWWNGQEMLLEAYPNIQLISSANRKIYDTGPLGEGYGLHFWGDVQIDFGRDAARQMLSMGCAPARTEVPILRHNSASKLIRGTFTYSEVFSGGSIEDHDPGPGNFGTRIANEWFLNRTDMYGNPTSFEHLLEGDIIYLFNRHDREQYLAATLIEEAEVYSDHVFLLVNYGAAPYIPAVGHVIDIEANRRVLFATLEDNTADVLYRDPYRRVALNYGNASNPNATYSIKAHDEIGNVLHLESQADDISRMYFDVFMRETIEQIQLALSHNFSLLGRGVTTALDVLDLATGVLRNAITITAKENAIPDIHVNGVFKANQSAVITGLLQVIGDSFFAGVLKANIEGPMVVFAEKRLLPSVAASDVLYGAQSANDNADVGFRDGATAFLRGGDGALTTGGNGGNAVVAPGRGQAGGVDGLCLLAGTVYGSIRAVANTNVVTLSGTTAATPIWNTNHDSNGVVPDEATGSLTVPVNGFYRVSLNVRTAATQTNKRVLAQVALNGAAVGFLTGTMNSNGAGFLGGFMIETNIQLSAGDVLDVDFAALDGVPATTITVSTAELYAELKNAEAL